MVDVTGLRGEPWQVTRSHTGDGYVVHLIIAGVMIVLPALEAHKLGSALHAASGIDTSSDESSAEGASASPSAESPGVPERGTSGTPSDFYVCPNHAASGGYDPSIMCGGWDEDAEQGRLCTEALEAGEAGS